MVCKLHGFPKSIISNRDPIFMSRFWQELFKLNGTKLRMSTTYHPQSNGRTKVLNQVLQQYLRAFIYNQLSQWGKFLSLTEWCYNTTCHSTTQMTPYEVTYGKPPSSIPQYLPGTSSVEVVNFLQASRQEVFQLLRKKLERTQEQMKKVVDAHRRVTTFVVGDWVYVKLRPYR